MAEVVGPDLAEPCPLRRRLEDAVAPVAPVGVPPRLAVGAGEDEVAVAGRPSRMRSVLRSLRSGASSRTERVLLVFVSFIWPSASERSTRIVRSPICPRSGRAPHRAGDPRRRGRTRASRPAGRELPSGAVRPQPVRAVSRHACGVAPACGSRRPGWPGACRGSPRRLRTPCRSESTLRMVGSPAPSRRSSSANPATTAGVSRRSSSSPSRGRTWRSQARA